MKSYISALILTIAAATCGATSTSDSLTLATYNIHSGIPKGFNGANYFAGAPEIRNIADVLTTTGATIIALQEVRNLWPPRGEFKDVSVSPDIALGLATVLNKNFAFGSTLIVSKKGLLDNRDYLEWGSPEQWTNNGAIHGEYGNAILSDYSITTPTIHKLPRGDFEGTDTADEPRNALRVELADVAPLGKVVVYSTHFQHTSGKTRKAQMENLLQVAKKDTATATVFLMGDFNHSPQLGEPDLLDMVKAAGFYDLAADYAAATKSKPAPTIGEGMVKIRIDYVFCSKPVKVTDVKVLDTNVSDHYPLAVTIKAP